MRRFSPALFQFLFSFFLHTYLDSPQGDHEHLVARWGACIAHRGATFRRLSFGAVWVAIFDGYHSFFTIIIALCGAIEKKFSTPTCPAFAMPCFWWMLCARCDRDARMLAQSVRDRPLAALLNLAAILFYEASLHHFTPGWIAHRENGN